MDTNELFDIAIGMGLNKPFMGVNKILYCDEELQDYPEFNPTIGDLMEWLQPKGDILVQQIGIVTLQFIIHESWTFMGSGETLKDKLLLIVLQVIRAEKEK